MKVIVWVFITFFIFLSIFLMGLSMDIKKLIKAIRKGADKGNQAIDKTLEAGRKTKIGRLIEVTESKIQRSNLRLYIPYNALTHFLICTLAFMGAFMWMSNHMDFFISLIFGATAFAIPYVMLQVLGDMMNARIRKYSVDFLIILKNFHQSVGGDIFEAFLEGKEYFIEPLKTYADLMVYEYKNKINPVRAMDNFIEKVESNEIKIFMENLKICFTNGGDTVALVDGFINEIDNLNDDSDKEDTKDRLLNSGLYVLLIANYLIVAIILNSEYRMQVVNTLWGKTLLVLDFLITIYIVYMTLKKE